jgi:DNA-directed RNA polymerase subunit E"
MAQKKKVCKKCMLIVDGETCPLCKGNQFSNSWQGRIVILDPVKSPIAKALGISAPGEYALKVR